MNHHAIRSSRQVRQDFLDFFKSKRHTIVSSSSLRPDSPNLLFTNAGMNQFVPIFLGQQKCPYTPGRAVDTQKCIRAGGKHNDLEDVGLDTYHHTFFEMLGNWSFGDYFKKEAIEWAWELVTGVWRFPQNRLYATVYQPDKSQGDPAEFDQEAYDQWARLFRAAGLDPQVHIVSGNKKDNFWMMGETGPCGPCSELHVDLTPRGDTRGRLVNQGAPQCIEIWNLVFMQFNANPDGTFSPLPAKSVDTGMGFERVTSILQCTRNFADFTGIISNYETDVFRPIFDRLEQLSGKKYGSTLPNAAGSTGNLPVPLGDPPSGRGESCALPGKTGLPQQSPSHSAGLVAQQDGQVARSTQDQCAIDIAFRVIADHIRTLSFAIADGIQPGNTDRNYVLRRILRRAVRYGRTLGFHEPFFYKLVDVVADTMGEVFPDIRAQQKNVQGIIRVEEEAFNKTLDRGIEQFDLRAGWKQWERDEVTFVRPRFKKIIEIESSQTAKLTQSTQKERTSLAEEIVQHVQKTRLSSDWFNCPENGRLFLESLEEFGNCCRSQVIAVHGSKLFDVVVDQFTTRTKEVEAGLNKLTESCYKLDGSDAFQLYDTYGFPLDLTELMARERGLTVDVEGFNKLMEEQKARARAAQKKTIIELSQIETQTPTQFVGYDTLETPAKVLEVVGLKDKTAVILDVSACYAEMGGQVGDTGKLALGNQAWRITNTQKSGNTWLHFVEEGVEAASLSGAVADRIKREGATVETVTLDRQSDVSPIPVGGSPTGTGESPVLPGPGDAVLVSVDAVRRAAIQRHHTVTHLLHWALHEVVSKEASQKGSFVGPDKLTFDFNGAPLTPQQVAEVERLVNERIVENSLVSAREMPFAEIKNRPQIIQFFGEKYGDTVRVIQIGGLAGQFDGYSMELCGGTHCHATGDIGLFRIAGEGAIAAGVRRIEALAGLCAYQKTRQDAELLVTLAGRVNSPVGELEKKLENLLAYQKELEKQLRAGQQKQAAELARGLVTKARISANNASLRVIAENLGEVESDFVLAVVDALKSHFKGVVVLGGASGGSVALMATVSPEFTHQAQAGKIIQAIAPMVGGRGGGKPDFARGGGKDASKLDEALAKVAALV